jgi:hypothetical protein
VRGESSSKCIGGGAAVTWAGMIVVNRRIGYDVVKLTEYCTDSDESKS